MERTGANITIRKDGRYMGKFIVGYDDRGKAQYQYVYGRTYDEAESKVVIGQQVASHFLSSKYITVSKVYAEWLNAVVNRVKESTLANYKAKFEKHILPVFGDIPCADLSAGRINEYINQKLADGLSASYVKDIITVFKALLSYAQDEYGFKLSLKNVTLPKIERKQIARISDTEQKRLIDYLKANMSLTAFGILLSLCMGLRIGELCGLKWKDVDFQHKILHIRRTVQRITSTNGNRKTKIVISVPKSATSFRDIAIPDALRGNFPLTSIVIKSRFSETWRISPCLRTESADFSSARLLPPFGGFLAVIARIGASATFYLLCRRFGRWSYRSRSAVMPSLCSQYYCNKARRSYCATWAAV